MKEEKIKKVKRRAKRRIALSTLLMLALTLSMNTFAWFLFSTKVDSGVSAYIRAWKVSFEVGQDEIIQEIDFDVNNIYPGMSTFTDSVTVKNNGESNAAVSFSVKSIRILDHEYSVDSGSYNSVFLQSMLENNYPFKIMVTQSKDIIEPNSTGTFGIEVYWPFESGNDDVDTYWGEQAGDYKAANPTEPSISVTLTISAVQSNESTSTDPEPEPEP